MCRWHRAIENHRCDCCIVGTFCSGCFSQPQGQWQAPRAKSKRGQERGEERRRARCHLVGSAGRWGGSFEIFGLGCAGRRRPGGFRSLAACMLGKGVARVWMGARVRAAGSMVGSGFGRQEGALEQDSWWWRVGVGEAPSRDKGLRKWEQVVRHDGGAGL